MNGEILAPCGSVESLEAAVRAGADAVYFGSGDFNARRNARNFEGEALDAAIRFCRERGVKTHLTLNTLVHDDEFSAAMALAKHACEAGIDALIVQDPGLAREIRKCCPSLPLHASTQMTIHDANGVRQAARMGFCRVVVSRELSLTELQSVCDAARELQVEVEAFVHGALCMSFSGQCYLSAMLGCRSGNRGLCAQPCRLAFAAEGGTGHDLSLKDLSYLEQIPTLLSLGVCSLKIEGRRKGPEYVAAAVTAAREARDEGHVREETARALRSIFSRSGFTDGYLNARRGREMFGVRTEEDETLTQETKTSLHELYRREFPRVPVRLSLNASVGELPALIADDGEHRVTVTGEEPAQAGRTRTLTAEDACAQLSKCGGTPYRVISCTAELGGGVMLPASVLNALRRNALENLTALRAIPPVREWNEPTPPQTVKMTGGQTLRARFFRELPQNFSGITRAYLPWDAPEEAFDRLLREVPQVGAELPRFFGADIEKLENRLEFLRQKGVRYALCEHHGAAFLAQRLGFCVDGGMFSHCLNSHTAMAYSELGYDSVTLSFEATLEQAGKIRADIPTGIVAYGYLPLMLTRNCPLKNGKSCAGCEGGELTDRKGIRFFTRCRDSVSEVFNSRPLDLLDRRRECDFADFLLLYFTRESGEEIEEILGAANERRAPAGRGEFTRGLAYRGVL